MLPRVLASSSGLVAGRTSAPGAKGVRREGEDTAVHEDTSMHEDTTVHKDIAVHQDRHRVPRGVRALLLLLLDGSGGTREHQRGCQGCSTSCSEAILE